MFASPEIIAFSIIGLDVRFYGVFMALAISIGLFSMYLISKKYYKNTDPETLLDFFPYMLFSAVLGARLYYVALNLDYYLAHKAEIFAIWHGGISIHGAILGGLVAGILFFKFKNKKILPYADVVSFGLVLGQAIGRWGNFFNSEAYGAPTNLPWKLYIAPEFRPPELVQYSYFHPTFLYECLWDIFVFLILFFIVRKIAKNKAGIVFYAYLILYSIGRFFIEQLRIDSVLNLSTSVGTIPVAQVASIILIIVGICGLLFIARQNSTKSF